MNLKYQSNLHKYRIQRLYKRGEFSMDDNCDEKDDASTITNVESIENMSILNTDNITKSIAFIVIEGSSKYFLVYFVHTNMSLSVNVCFLN